MPVVSQDVSAAGAGNREFVQELDDGAALLLGAEAEILAHRPVLPRPFLDNWPLAGRKAPDLAPRRSATCWGGSGRAAGSSVAPVRRS